MRGQDIVVTAIRRPDGGLLVEPQTLPKFYTGRMRKTPFLRGIIVLIESMVLGVKNLLHSADVSLEEEGEEISGWLLWLIVAGSLVFAVALFFLAPLFLTKLFNFNSTLIFNLVDGVIRVIIIIAYLRLMGLMRDIKRVFAFHGAEHKVVNAYENGVPLEVDAVKKYSTAHTRCGTGFIFIVLIISIIVFAITGLHSVWLMVLSRIVLIPVIAAFGYEFIRYAGAHSKNPWVRLTLGPGLWLQSMTTREPDEGQLEAAITALKKVIEADRGEIVQESPSL